MTPQRLRIMAWLTSLEHFQAPKRMLFFQSDVDAFLNNDVGARNYLPANHEYDWEESNVDDFPNSKVKIEKFEDTLLIPHEKDDRHSFFILFFNAIRYWGPSHRRDNDELANDLLKNLFQKEFVLQLRFQTFKNPCFLVNKILMSEKYFFRFHELRKKFRFMTHTDAERNKIARNLLSCTKEKIWGYKVVWTEYKRKLTVKFESVNIIFDLAKHFKMKINCYFLTQKHTGYIHCTKNEIFH